MNSYELILLFDPALGEDKIRQVVAKIEDKIKSLGGEVEKTEEWGAKKLASRVRKAKRLTQGYYVLIRWRGSPSLPAELGAFLRVTENVIRYFISRAVEAPPPAEERIEGVPLEAVNVGEIKSEGEEVKLGQP